MNLDKPMTSRDRIRKTLNRQPTDRIPNGLFGCETTGMHVVTYNRLKRILGCEVGETQVGTFMLNAVADPAVLNAIQGDIILLGSRMCPARLWGVGSELDWKPADMWGERFRLPIPWNFHTEADGTMHIGSSICPSGSYYFDSPVLGTGVPMASSSEPLNPDKYNPSGDIPDAVLRNLEEQGRWLYENTEFSILCGEFIEDLQMKSGGTEAWWISLLEEPETVHEMLNKACEAGIKQIRLLDQAVGKYADMLHIADDIGDSRGVSIGPDLWREIYLPHYKKLFAGWHKETRMKISMHSCGSISDILDDLIECGLDIINPVQSSARGMDPETMKTRFGERVILYGGAYDAILNPPGTSEEMVYEQVSSAIRTLGRNGGYFFSGVHNLPGDVPETHLRAILNAWKDNSVYARVTG